MGTNAESHSAQVDINNKKRKRGGGRHRPYPNFSRYKINVQLYRLLHMPLRMTSLSGASWALPSCPRYFHLGKDVYGKFAEGMRASTVLPMNNKKYNASSAVNEIKK